MKLDRQKCRTNHFAVSSGRLWFTLDESTDIDIQHKWGTGNTLYRVLKENGLSVSQGWSDVSTRTAYIPVLLPRDCWYDGALVSAQRGAKDEKGIEELLPRKER